MSSAAPISVGLRVDVDTLRGTRYGVPRLLDLLAKHRVGASFFLCVGPDNMGRHLWRLLKPQFFAKMVRSHAVSLYGWDIFLRGTFWPGKEIGLSCASIIREAASATHEIGLHAWDHHAWQSRSDRWTVTKQQEQTGRGLSRLGEIIGRRIDCSAVAGWRCDQRTVDAKEAFTLRYNSDCRGSRLFRPRLSNGAAGTPQIPVTLPTYDEVAGRETDATGYNEYILSRMKPGQLNVYTIHAEVEGIALARNFDRTLRDAADRGIGFVTLGSLLPSDIDTLPIDSVTQAPLPGREGWVGWQASSLKSASD